MSVKNIFSCGLNQVIIVVDESKRTIIVYSVRVPEVVGLGLLWKLNFIIKEHSSCNIPFHQPHKVYFSSVCVSPIIILLI